MGSSLYNRIYLGRRHALFNLRRLCAAAAGCVTLGVVFAAWMFAG